MTARFDAQSLELLVEQILVGAGADEQDAGVVANNLVGANKRGIDSHGVLRLQAYMTAATEGQIDMKAKPVVVSETPGTAVVDAQHGWGAPSGAFAMNLAIQKAANTGIAAVGVKNSNHFGYAAYYGMMAVERNMIGLAFTNSKKNQAPWGAKQSYFGTNPICVCIPAAKERPIVYDGATTVVAQGKIMLARKKHAEIPPTWALDKTGKPTTDPNTALEAGLLMPMGTYKGADLALVVDVLSGVLPGGVFGPVVAMPALLGNRNRIGHFFMALDLKAFGDVEEFKANIDKMVQDIKKLPIADGFERAYLPGEPEFELEEERMKQGIPVVDDVLTELKNLAAKFGVKMPEPIA